MTFLPKDYEIPEANTGYMKFKQGDNKFRVLGSAVIGYETWVEDDEGNRKPRRYRMEDDIIVDEIGDSVKHFWAFPVWNYGENRVQILEITQKGIMKSIKALTSDEDWGDPKEYDLVVNREGEGLETEYQVSPKPKKELEKKVSDFYKELDINLEALFDGKDPFEKMNDFDVPEEAIK